MGADVCALVSSDIYFHWGQVLLSFSNYVSSQFNFLSSKILGAFAFISVGQQLLSVLVSTEKRCSLRAPALIESMHTEISIPSHF